MVRHDLPLLIKTSENLGKAAALPALLLIIPLLFVVFDEIILSIQISQVYKKVNKKVNINSK